MERSHLPMMQHQLVLRLMAAARAAADKAEAGDSSSAGSDAGGAGGAAGPRLSLTMPRSSSGGSGKSLPLSRMGSTESGSAHVQHQQQYKQFQKDMCTWFGQQYAKCRAGASLLGSATAAPPSFDHMGQPQQQLPPHLMAYTPSLRQAGGMHRMGLRGHIGPIRKVVITPDGKDVLTASDDGTVQV